jgi:hypothetical protein
VEIRTDPFQKNLSKSTAKQRRGDKDIRRPYRGIEVKDDTYAIMQVIRADGTKIPLVDAGAGGGIPIDDPANPFEAQSGDGKTYQYSNFIIQSVQDMRQEKAQILETFGDPYVFFFGERPRTLAVSGLLMNTHDFNWRSEFWYNYENTLRGTKLVEQNARIYLYYDDIIVEGYMMQAQATDDANLPYHIPFNFQLFVTGHTYLSSIGEEDFPIRYGRTSSDVQSDVPSRNTQISAVKRAIADQEGTSHYFRRKLNASGYAAASSAATESAAGGAVINAAKLATNLGAMTAAGFGSITDGNVPFLSLLAHFYRQRKVLFPKGMAGAEVYSGAKTSANKLIAAAVNPPRALPYRSKITDNVDEYVSSNAVGYSSSAQWDEAQLAASTAEKRFKDANATEAKALADLTKMGVRPIQHPGPAVGVCGIKAFGITTGSTLGF